MTTLKELKEYLILFSAPMVNAILDDRKTMTRRVVNPQPEIAYIERNGGWLEKKTSKGGNIFLSNTGDEIGKTEHGWLKFPYGGGYFRKDIIGTLLWVREAWQALAEYDHLEPSEIPAGSDILYNADRPDMPWDSRKRNLLFMPRWASRIQLKITDIRVERLHDISEEDAKSEGIVFAGKSVNEFDMYAHRGAVHTMTELGGLGNSNVVDVEFIGRTAKQAFTKLWHKINGTESWAQNPWVWAVEFERIKP